MRAIGHRIGEQHGVSLIEVMVAVLVLTIGILALLTSFNSAQKLTLTAERRTALVHRAQRRIERLETYAYQKLAMTAAPSHESGTPNEYVDYNNPIACKEVEGAGCFAWNDKNTAEEEPLALAETGTVSAAPEEWSAGNVSGKTYSYVTWATDAVCKEEICPAENDYKRVTVIVTASLAGGREAMTPVRVSSLIANPNAAPKEGTPSNPLRSPGTTCVNPETNLEEQCTTGVDAGAAQSWFLHDSSAEESEAAGKVIEPQGSHATHPTVAETQAKSCEGSQHEHCPKPDLMISSPPTAEYLYDYSTDQDAMGATLTHPPENLEWLCPGVEGSAGGCYGGRVLARSGVGCDAAPSRSEPEDNFRSEMWVTPPLESETTLTGAGGLAVYTQTVNGVSAPATLCVGVYRVPQGIEDLWAEERSTPELIGWSSYSGQAGAGWPATLEQASFAFEPTSSAHSLQEPSGATVGEAGGTPVVLKAGERIGLRLWLAASSGTDAISLIYGTGGHAATIQGAATEAAKYPALFQLNTE